MAASPDLTTSDLTTSDLIAGFVRALGPRAPAPDAVRAAVDLLARWDSADRHYHDRAHLTATLAAVGTLLTTPDADLAEVDRDTVELAVWFHDAVHDGRAGDDEEASALLAERVLTALGRPPARVAEVARLVRLTTDHDAAPADAAGRVLCDADLSILGAPAERYRAYTEAVRREYGHVPEAAFRTGRAAVLRALTEAGPLFRTERGRRLWQRRALANVTAELRALSTPNPAAGQTP